MKSIQCTSAFWGSGTFVWRWLGSHLQGGYPAAGQHVEKWISTICGAIFWCWAETLGGLLTKEWLYLKWTFYWCWFWWDFCNSRLGNSLWDQFRPPKLGVAKNLGFLRVPANLWDQAGSLCRKYLISIPFLWLFSNPKHPSWPSIWILWCPY